MGQRQGCWIMTLLHYPHTWFFTALFRENPAQILAYISERLPYPLAKVLVTCLERDTFFKRPFPVTTCSASFRPPFPHHSLFPCGGLSLSPSPSHCTFLTLPLQLHTYSSWFSLPHTRTLSLSHPKHTHYCSIPAKGFFPIAVWVNKSKYEKTETDTHSLRGKHHLSNSVHSYTYECGQFMSDFFLVE